MYISVYIASIVVNMRPPYIVVRNFMFSLVAVHVPRNAYSNDTTRNYNITTTLLLLLYTSLCIICTRMIDAIVVGSLTEKEKNNNSPKAGWCFMVYVCRMIT